MAKGMELLVLVLFVVLGIKYGSSVEMVINPPTIHLDTHLPPSVSMVCGLSVDDQKEIVHQMTSLIIYRHSKRDIAKVAIAYIHADNQAKLGSVTDVTQRIPRVSGEIHQGDNTVADLHWAELIITWVSNLIECHDDGEYTCVWSYIDDKSTTQYISKVTTFSVQDTAMMPSIQLQLFRDGSPIGDHEGTYNNKYQALVGSELQMRCFGSIGTSRGTAIDWYRTNPSDETNSFEKFVLGPNDELHTGVAAEDHSNCRFTRETNLKYVVRLEDLGGRHTLAFKCAITVNLETTDSDRLIFVNAVTDMIPGISAAMAWKPANVALWILPLPVLVRSLLTS